MSALTRPAFKRRGARPDLYRRLDPDANLIRLFAFDQDHNGQISGTLSTFALDDPKCPHWVALSYSGHPLEEPDHRGTRPLNGHYDSHSINIDGYTVPIRANLLRAIRALSDQKIKQSLFEDSTDHENDETPMFEAIDRKYFDYTGWDRPESWRYFWIDAICINQTDMEERQNQIALANRILSRASSVICWLPPSDDLPHKFSKSPLLDLLKLQSDDKRYSPVIPRSPKSPPRSRISIEDCASEHYQSIAHNPYWQRMWIVQEVILARRLNFLYGQVWLTETYIRELLRQRSAPANCILRHRELFQKAKQKRGAIDFQELLDNYSFKQCSDVRDRVFGMLALLTDDFPIKADYSLSAMQVFLLLLEYQGSSATTLHIRSWYLALDLNWHDPIIESHLWLHSHRESHRKRATAKDSTELRVRRSGPSLLDVVTVTTSWSFHSIMVPIGLLVAGIWVRLFEIFFKIASRAVELLLDRGSVKTATDTRRLKQR